MNDIWADIERLSELRSNYNCFDEKEEPYYRALSNAIQALRREKHGMCLYETVIAENARPQGEWEVFARWVAKEVLDDYFEESSGAFAEIACRKLVKLGLVEVKDNVYKMKGGAE